MNHEILLLVLQSIRFLERQVLLLRGYGIGPDSNFAQLLHLRGVDHEGIDLWLSKKANLYTTPEKLKQVLSADGTTYSS